MKKFAGLVDLLPVLVDVDHGVPLLLGAGRLGGLRRSPTPSSSASGGLRRLLGGLLGRFGGCLASGPEHILCVFWGEQILEVDLVPLQVNPMGAAFL